MAGFLFDVSDQQDINIMVISTYGAGCVRKRVPNLVNAVN